MLIALHNVCFTVVHSKIHTYGYPREISTASKLRNNTPNPLKPIVADKPKARDKEWHQQGTK